MNTAAAIEIAVAAVLRQFATLGEGVVVRPSQSLNSDPTWKKSKDRTYPMVSVQCSTPDPEDGNPAVMEASCRVVCGTWNDDDKDHNKVREMFDGATSCLSRLFGAFRKGNEAEELSLFREKLLENVDPAFFETEEWALKMRGGDEPVLGEANYYSVSLIVKYQNPAFC